MRDSAVISLVQLTDTGDPDDALARMPAFFEEAAAQGADLIVFPEYVLGDCIPVSHPRVQAFFKLVAKHGMYAIAGVVEQHNERRATTALMVDRQGNLLGRYLKCHPAAGPGPHWWPPTEGFDAEARGWLGNAFKVFHLDFGTVGILQCYDGYFPEAWGCTSYAGAEVILWINGREGIVEDFHCLSAASAYGCVVGGNITNGANTGFAGPFQQFVDGEGEKEESRLFPRLARRGDGIVHGTVDLAGLRRHRKHLRTMHQRRPELYGALVREVRMWQDYPDIPWDLPECAEMVNKAQL